MDFLQVCSHCGEKARCRRRDFSEQAWSALLIWGEIEPGIIEKPICDTCYNELREILIDRSDEIENPQKPDVQKPTKIKAQKAIKKKRGRKPKKASKKSAA